MPTYVYKCVQCEKITEVTQRITDPPLENCIECSGEIKRVIQATPVHFKGGGWYSTTYPKRQK